MSNDSDLYTDIMNKLAYEPSIVSSNSTITIAVHNGIVTLAGSVGSYFEKRAAEKAASNVIGVKAVANEIEVKLPQHFKLNDTEIAASALAALNANIIVPKDRIKVTVENGRIILHGSVNWWFERRCAEKAVRDLIGVTDVNNHIAIKPFIAPKDVKKEITKEFARNAEIDARRIHVETHNGKVTLKGIVHSKAEMKEALHAAWSVSGVYEVNNQLRISEPKLNLSTGVINMKISEICKKDVVTVALDTSIDKAAKIMKQASTGSLVVIDSKTDKATGIITDRDIVIKVIAEGKNPSQCKVSEFMSKHLYTESEDTDVAKVISIMQEKGIRRVPIVDTEQHLCGIVSLDDLCLMVDQEQDAIAQIIRKQISKSLSLH
ncbi:MAG: osmY [Gammaproteobacteria bacterium]|jgi:osmotically-inducible protein OsmY/CBS domain-containing protein|nr:osmY [Gammaproteobacteria bacterium]